MVYMRLNLIVRVSKWYLGDGQGLWLFCFLLEWHNYFEEKYLASQISFCAKNTHNQHRNQKGLIIFRSMHCLYFRIVSLKILILYSGILYRLLKKDHYILDSC